MFFLLILISQICQYSAWADICQIDFSPGLGGNLSEIEYGSTRPTFITCPGPVDPQEHTACCYLVSTVQENTTIAGVGNSPIPACCHPDATLIFFYSLGDKLALYISIAVTTLLLIVTIVIVICCFWSRCPLYMTCRVKYHQDDIIAYASKDETTNLNGMPPEERNGVTLYSPNAVKVTLKDDV